ncbi:putative late blight resistance protein homolog R1A-3 isoform X2 [Primulina tabacum]|uniref:putative late blight resistance protein homolog R1A-3 isoform X2 n=1 Tax=Primulina tabacum TaxID=48773 RepID=UPI003F59381A
MENTGHFVTFDAVVSLLQDLELIMSSPNYILDPNDCFSSAHRKEDIKILYDKISSLHSSFCNSSGLSYEKVLMDRWGHWIRFVVSLAQEYIDSWVWGCVPPPNVEKESGRMSHPKLRRVAESMEFMKDQLKKIRVEREAVRESTHNFGGATLTGQPFTVLDMSSRIPSPLYYTYVLDDIEFLRKRDFRSVTDNTIMFDNFREIKNFMQSRREGYEKKMIENLESLTRFETRIAKDYMRVYMSIPKDASVRRPYIEMGIIESTGFINKQLKEIYDVRYILENPPRGKRGQSSTDLDVFRRTFRVKDFEKYDYVVSILQDLQCSFINEHYLPCPFRKGDIEVLYENLRLMHSFLIDSSGKVYDEKLMSHLEMWINGVADIAQDYLDSWVWSCLKKPYIEKPTNMGICGAGQIFNRKMCRITDTIEFIHNQLKRSHDNGEVLRLSTVNVRDQTSAGPSFIGSNMLPKTPNDEFKLVGLEDDLIKMLDCLTRKSSKLEVFAVTGMGGIGKTTFTKSLYDHPLVKHDFDIRAWFTISQQYQLREVLIGLLRCISDSVTGLYERDNAELKDTLYKSLKGMRYLIVLDDMWDKKVWDDLKTIFPNDRNDSRIVLTSRLDDVATHASQNTHCLRCLDDDESWELLYSKISTEELCPELLLIGKEIACKCQGLPLAIVVVGGLLSKMNKKLDIWKDVAQNVSSKVVKESNYCENILALSYNHLPDHLKSCFLYLGTFPEDHKILAKKLVWLWIVEGFIRPENLKSVEEVAENYLEDLIARNLIQVKRKSSDGKIKICYIHDLLRDLCLIESYKQNFYLAFNKHGQLMKPAYENDPMVFELEPRRICFPSSTPDLIISPLFPPIRSFLWFQAITLSDPDSYFFMNFKLLKVLDITYLNLEELPSEISHMANLRYLALSFRKYIDRSIFSSTFHNIQFLIIEGEWNGLLPKEFWAMSELRHFHLKRSFLSYWPKESGPNIMQLASTIGFPQALICQVQYEEHSLKVLENLQSLSTIRPISCTKAIFISMPNLKKLRVYENEEDYGFRGWFNNLIHLKELQTLKYVFRDPFVSGFMKPVCLPSPDFFPQKLMNLTLSGTSFLWEDMLKLSALPVLEVLKLENYAFAGPILKSEGSGFPQLRYFFIGRTNLKVWEADGSHFPRLKHLVIMNCRLLKEIPCGIGELPLLEKIELCNCSESASASAEQILLEQQSYGNDNLVVHIM